MQSFRSELHVHTVLSPCAQIEMIPPLIVRQALEQEIHLIAITDHNASANVWAVQKAAEGTDLVVLPGMEVQTREDVHVLCIFDTLDQLEALQTFVDQHLPSIKNNPDFFGEQFVVDETGEFIRREHRLLINSVDASFEDVWHTVHQTGGLFIPAHVNRKAFGMIASLGLVPTSVTVFALEISRHIQPADACRLFPQIKSYPLIQSGDVHGLDDFVGSTIFQIERPTIAELKLAIQQKEGRSINIDSPLQSSLP